MFILVIYLMFFSCLVAGVLIFVKSKKNSIFEKLIISVLPFVTLTAVMHILSTVLYAPFNGWNAARLIQAFTISKGYKLYYSLGEGPAITSCYGPIPALAYLITTI